MASRDLSILSSKHYDVLVIGAGIYGSAIAWDAALRGFSVALVDKGDFGAATSSGCFKIVHGGLRYLQHLDFGRLYESMREQKILRKIAPHLVHPMPFLIPTYGTGKRAKGLLRLGNWLYELITAERNRGVEEGHRLPGHRAITRDECLSLAPGLNPDGLTGAVIYYDCQMTNCERLTFGFAKAAAAAGADIFNYIELVDSQVQGEGALRQISSVQLHDRQTQQTLEVQAKMIVNATGPWVSKVNTLLACEETSVKQEPRFSKGVQVVLPKVVADYGVALESAHSDSSTYFSRGSRSYFMVPWRGHTLLGTGDVLFEGDPEAYRISREEVNTLLEEAAAFYRSDLISADNVQYSFGGLRPIDPGFLQTLESSAGKNGEESGEGNIPVARRDEVCDFSESASPIANVISVVGVKYTTCRKLAERVVDLLQRKLKTSNKPCQTAETALPGAPAVETESYQAFVEERVKCWSSLLGSAAIQRLIENYGTESDVIVDIIEGDPETKNVLDPKTSVMAAELIYAAREESVVHLSDAVFRRTGLGTLGVPDTKVLEEVASVVGAELGWQPSRGEEEVGSILGEQLGD